MITLDAESTSDATYCIPPGESSTDSNTWVVSEDNLIRPVNLNRYFGGSYRQQSKVTNSRVITTVLIHGTLHECWISIPNQFPFQSSGALQARGNLGQSENYKKLVRLMRWLKFQDEMRCDTALLSSEEDDLREKARSFLLGLKKTFTTAGEVAAIRTIYKTFFELRRQGEDLLCDVILELLDVHEFSPAALLAVLTITSAQKSKMPNRRAFFERCRSQIQSVRGADATQELLDGLE